MDQISRNDIEPKEQTVYTYNSEVDPKNVQGDAVFGAQQEGDVHYTVMGWYVELKRWSTLG